MCPIGFCSCVSLTSLADLGVVSDYKDQVLGDLRHFPLWLRPITQCCISPSALRKVEARGGLGDDSPTSTIVVQVAGCSSIEPSFRAFFISIFD